MDPITLLIYIGVSLAIAYLSQPKPLEPPKPAGLEEFDIPTATEGRPVQVLFGKRRIKGANVVWFGDLKSTEIKKGGSSGFLGIGKTKPQTVGYKYFLGMHLILGYSNADGVKQIWVGEKCVWPTPNNSTDEAVDGETNITINAHNIFGGEEKGGGIGGIGL